MKYCTDQQLLVRNSRVYETLLNSIFASRKKGNENSTLNRLQGVAKLASDVHVGRFADGRIENVALEIGENLDQLITEASYSSIVQSPEQYGLSQKKRRVLHVATKLLQIGGHTQLLRNWIQNDSTTCHSVVITSQGANDIPEDILEGIAQNGGRIIPLGAGNDILAKSSALRSFAWRNADVVILHVHQFDLIPIVAFATRKCPPVGFMNHSDHTFWLGSSISDTTIEMRTFGRFLSQSRRFAQHTEILPVPIKEPNSILSKELARRKLGIPASQVMLLTIGSAYKYVPTESHNFFDTTQRVLDDNPEAHLYLIGVRPEDATRYGSPGKASKRIHCLGIVTDPSLYRSAADIYVEGFPINSYTALLESVALGACPVLMFAPDPQLVLEDDPGLKGIVSHPRTEEEYVELVSQLIRDVGLRQGVAESAKRGILAYHVAEKWENTLGMIYEFLEKTEHSPGCIPVTECEDKKEDQVRVQLSRYLVDDYPVCAFALVQGFTVKDWARWLSQSVRLGDTTLDARHLRPWLGALKSLVVKNGVI